MRRRAVLLSGLATLLIATKTAALSVYVAEDGQVLGPFDEATLRARMGSRTKAAVTLVWMQGMADWAPADKVPELAALVARLPLDLPFDVAAYLIGAWISEDQPLGKGSQAFVGKSSVVFAADGTVTALHTGERTTVRVSPGAKPREPDVKTKFLFWNVSMAGTYTVKPGAEGFFVVELKGTTTDNSSGASGETARTEESFDFRRLGPDHMQTRYGVDYRRTAN